MTDLGWNDAAVISTHVAMGVGLAACAGQRAFLPLFVVGLAGRFGYLPLSESFGWLAGTPALTVFGAALVAEALGDKVPAVDHFLDWFQTLVKPVAGAMVMASVVSEWSPLYVTVVAIIGGGSIAGLVHVAKANLRIVSTAGTAGLANPVVSTAEDAGAVALSLASIAWPVVVAAALVVGLGLLGLLYRRLVRRPA